MDNSSLINGSIMTFSHIPMGKHQPLTESVNTDTGIVPLSFNVRGTIEETLVDRQTSPEIPQFPDWIPSALTVEQKKHTLKAFETAPENLKKAVETRERIWDEKLKRDTTFLYNNGRWNINLPGCSRILFDPQGYISAHRPDFVDRVQHGVMAKNAGNMGQHFYFTMSGARAYADTQPYLKLATDLGRSVVEWYGQDLGKILGIKYIGWLNHVGVFPEECRGGECPTIGSVAMLRFEFCKTLHIHSDIGASVTGGYRHEDTNNLGYSVLFQDTSPME